MNKMSYKQIHPSSQAKHKQIKPVQMIRFDQNKNLQLTQQAIDIFNKLQSNQISIVCVAGKYRTGKSYILNRVLLQQNHGFQVGPTINACTKGLWMWPEIVRININGHQKPCLIIDTEGLGSLEEGQNTDIKIFLMATLISSYLIYNSVGSIDQKALQSLNMVINMANLLQKKDNKFDSQQLINSFPSFMWLVRDFSLKLQNQNGQKITSQQYLENALKSQNGKSSAAQRKNQIRKQLKTFFQYRDCFTLIRPTSNQIDLQNLSKLPQSKLRPEFISLVSQLKKRIHSGIQPKKIRGKPINPQGFIQLCNYYISNINSGKIPSINSQWDNLCINQSGRLIKKYQLKLKQYICSTVQSSIKGQQQSITQMNQFYENLIMEAFDSIDRSFLGKLQKRLMKEKLQKTMKHQLRLREQLQRQKHQNQITNQIKYIFARLQNPRLNEQQQNNLVLPSYKENNTYNNKMNTKIQTIREIFEKFQQLQSQKMNKIDKINKTQVYENTTSWIVNSYRFFIEKVKDSILSVIENQLHDLSHMNRQLINRIKLLQNNVVRQSEKQTYHIKQLRNQIQSLTRKINQDKIKVNIHIKEKAQTQSQIISMKSQITLLKSQLEEFKQNQLKRNQQKSLIYIEQQKNSILKKKLLQTQSKCTQLQHANKHHINQVKEYQVKQRKMARQSQIHKQSILEKQKQIQSLSLQIDQLKTQITLIQKDNRKLIKNKSCKKFKDNSFTKINKFNSFFSYDDNKINHSKRALKTQVNDDQSLQSQNQSGQQMQKILESLNRLKTQNRVILEQNKTLTKLLNQQRSLNQILMNSAQSINVKSLRKNYDIEVKNSQSLSKRLKQLQNNLAYINKVECCICYNLISKNMMFSNHYLKCIVSSKKSLQFDVSYAYNENGQLNFLIEIQIQDNSQSDPLRRLGLVQSPKKPNKWQIVKSLKSIAHFLKHLNIPLKNIDTQEGCKLFIQVDKKQLKKLTPVQQEQKINLNQKRRLFLQQLCQTIKSIIWSHPKLMQFFAIDIHLMKKTKIKQNNKMITKRRKIGILNLDLGQIVEEDNQNDNTYNQQNKKILASSMNLMKTTKFSMKKVFKFGPHV